MKPAAVSAADGSCPPVNVRSKEEPATTVWFALRTDESTFWIVDAFPGAGERQAHLDGPIAAALMQNADRLLAAPPEILPADVLAAKVP